MPFKEITIMTEREFLKRNHRRIAQISVGASALRNQGASGIVEIARDYFYTSIPINTFFSKMKSHVAYREFLHFHTIELLQQFPKGGKSWGAARKGLNLFLRDIVYNKFFSDYYKLPTDYKGFNETIKHLEVPLDRDVAKGIQMVMKEKAKLPMLQWKSIKGLQPGVSDSYQLEALHIAERLKTARVNLDLKYWRQ